MTTICYNKIVRKTQTPKGKEVIMKDATYQEICELQKELAAHGISKEQLDLDNYAGLAQRELQGIVKAAINQENRRTKQ